MGAIGCPVAASPFTGEGRGRSVGDPGPGPSGLTKLLPALAGQADSAALGCRFGVSR